MTSRAGRRRAAGAVVAASLALLARPALAQPSASDDAFLQGKALMEQGRTAEACQRFAESLALERRGGTLLNLAVCREKEGRYATALRLLHEARDRAVKDGRADRAALADQRLRIVEGLVSWLTVRLAGGADAPDLAVQCDGEALPRETWGKLRAVDPGPHTVTAVATGRTRFEATVQVGEARDAQVVEIPSPVEARTAPSPPPPPATAEEHPAGPPEASAPVRVPGTAPLGWSRPVGWAAVGLGAAALATGTAFGVRAIEDIRASEPHCPKDVCATMTALLQNHDAHTAARVADVTLPLGLVAAAAGLTLLLVRRPSDPAAPRAAAGVLGIGVTAAGASLRGAF